MRKISRALPALLVLATMSVTLVPAADALGVCRTQRDVAASGTTHVSETCAVRVENGEACVGYTHKTVTDPDGDPVSDHESCDYEVGPRP